MSAVRAEGAFHGERSQIGTRNAYGKTEMELASWGKTVIYGVLVPREWSPVNGRRMQGFIGSAGNS